jgi:hypothetical protein
MAKQLLALFMEYNELLDCCLPKAEPLTTEMADQVAACMVRTGYSASVALDFAIRLQRHPRKRPADKRHSAIDAFELERADPDGWTWARLARQCYGCQHDEEKPCKCDELLRQEVIHVKRFLAKMHVPLPPTP